MDMALWLIRQASPLLAETTARHLVADSRPSQSAYAMSDHLAHADPLVQQFERWGRERLADGFSLDEAARAIGASKRTLARRINDVLGKSPLSYFRICASSTPCICCELPAITWRGSPPP
jgi:transcriptional regulator GlxA family with amidase domain